MGDSKQQMAASRRAQLTVERWSIVRDQLGLR